MTKVEFCAVCDVCEPPGVSECDGNVVSRVTEPLQAFGCSGLRWGVIQCSIVWGQTDSSIQAQT